MEKIRYVVGFLFSEDHAMVALVRKNRPQWQKGLLNGIGGKVEQGEMAEEAQRREFREEAGLDIDTWEWFLQIQGPDYLVDFYRAFGSVHKINTMTDEQLEIQCIQQLPVKECVPNLPWLVAMALCEPVVRGEYSLTNNREQREWHG